MTGRTIVKAAALAAALAVAPGASAAAAAEPDGSVVRAWSDLSFAAARSANLSDARAARMYAMVDAAMYDAVNPTDGGPPRQAAIVAAPGHVAGDPSAAAAGAAHDVLTALAPAQTADYDAELARDLAAVRSAREAQRGRDWGASVAAGVLAARSDDGSAPDATQPGDPAIGMFQDPWSGIQFQNLKPFAIADSGAYVGSGPPARTSPEYTDAFNEVKTLGNKNLPDAAKKATFDYWALGGRTNQPPGAWLQVAEDVSRSQHLSLRDTTRLFALESMALADTVAPTYRTKVIFHTWRPTRAIREADNDGNPDTVADPTWSARGGSAGGTPEHWSGHSSFSAAGATVLAGFFCDDRVPFTLTTDPTNGVPTETRSYSRFSTAALEAGRSRILGGLHFDFSNRAGLRAGVRVGAEVLSSALLREHGPTHHGSCPR
jgi:hypothetical protein